MGAIRHERLLWLVRLVRMERSVRTFGCFGTERHEWLERLVRMER